MPIDLMTINLVLIAAIEVASAVVRRRTGKPIFYTEPPNCFFSEKWLSGRSSNTIIPFVGAANCLWTTVTFDRIQISPHFPFSLGFLPEFWRLDHFIEPHQLISAEEIRGFGGLVLLTYQMGKATRKFRISVRRRREFLEAIDQMKTSDRPRDT